MGKVFCTIFLCTILLTACKADLCQYNFTLGEFPSGILADALSLLITGTIVGFAGCPSDVTINPNLINLWYWNQANPDVPILLDKNNPTQIDPNLPTIFLIPGWLCNVTNDRIPELKDAYLTKFTNANLIGIDWTEYSIALYTESFCFLPLIAQSIGKFICDINSNLGVDISQIHVVGHSMGGQVSGLIGQEVKKQCGQTLGRITAVDPAGPLYQTLPISRRLDKTDAARVDVIHSNMAQLGYYGTCGTVDFYPNCGYFQPGCIRITVETDPLDLLNLPVGVIACNHIRAIEYMVESINSDEFVSRSCDTCPGLPLVGPCVPDLIGATQIPMGEPTPANPPDTKYWLATNSAPPYARG